MLKKYFALVLSLFIAVPAFADMLDSAMASKPHVMLYLYTPSCGYCKKFNPNYQKLSKMYDKKYAFLKINAEEAYGNSLIREFKAYYVPYVLLIDSKSKYGKPMTPSCLLDFACMEKEIQKTLRS